MSDLTIFSNNKNNKYVCYYFQIAKALDYYNDNGREITNSDGIPNNIHTVKSFINFYSL